MILYTMIHKDDHDFIHSFTTAKELVSAVSWYIKGTGGKFLSTDEAFGLEATLEEAEKVNIKIADMIIGKMIIPD